MNYFNAIQAALPEFVVSQLSLSHRDDIEALKDGSFGFSFRSFLLYAHIKTSGLTSPGAFVSSPNATFALGIFDTDTCLAAHVICPKGVDWPPAIHSVAKRLLDKGIVSRVYVRHLASDGRDMLLQLGFSPIEVYPWLENAPAEDETYNHRLVHLHEIMQPSTVGSVPRDLPGITDKRARRKFRLAFQRFQNFLDRENARFELRPMDESQRPIAQAVVDQHFSHLDLLGKRVGSTASDYAWLIRMSMVDSPDTPSLVGWLVRTDQELPVSVFLGERLCSTRGGLYLTITLRHTHVLDAFGISDSTGFSALPQYAFSTLFSQLLLRGWTQVDLGGSETPALNTFKQELGSEECQSHWVVL